VLNKPSIRDTACKTNDFRVKDLSHSGAMTCNLCLELTHSPLQSHQTRFIQSFPSNAAIGHAGRQLFMHDLFRDFLTLSAAAPNETSQGMRSDISCIQMSDKQRRLALFGAQPCGTAIFVLCCVIPRSCTSDTLRSKCLA